MIQVTKSSWNFVNEVSGNFFKLSSNSKKAETSQHYSQVCRLNLLIIFWILTFWRILQYTWDSLLRRRRLVLSAFHRMKPLRPRPLLDQRPRTMHCETGGWADRAELTKKTTRSLFLMRPWPRPRRDRDRALDQRQPIKPVTYDVFYGGWRVPKLPQNLVVKILY